MLTEVEQNKQETQLNWTTEQKSFIIEIKVAQVLRVNKKSIYI